METDLFGKEVDYKHPDNGKRGRNAQAKGYAGKPGSGPAGETCKTCEHYCRVNHNAKHHLKCAVIEWRWTHGAGTDIKARSPACNYWQAQKGD